MNKIDFIILFDALDANPNGDPDAGNLPRIDGETAHGIVTDVCIKRKIRNFVLLSRAGESGYAILIKEKAVLNNEIEAAYLALGKDATTDLARKWMCQNFYDVRTFGAVLSTGSKGDGEDTEKNRKNPKNAGQVRGPVQISFARTFDPVTQFEYTITRCAVTKKEDEEKGRTMGMKSTVPYGLYMAKGCINPYLAGQTGFTEADLELLLQALQNLFAFDASAARPAGSMAVRKLILFRHNSKLGNAPAHKLYDSLHVAKKEGVEFPRNITDYDISLDRSAIPDGVTVEEIDC